MKKILCILLLIYSFHSFSQSPWIINETFPGNKLQWPVSNNEIVFSRLDDNGYEVMNKGKTIVNIFISLKLSENQDFFIETTFRQLSNNKNTGNGIAFACNKEEKQDGYAFIIAPNGNYRVYTLTGVDIIKPRYSGFINKNEGAANKLKVAQIGQRWLFFINDEEVDFVDRQNIFGDQGGLITGSNVLYQTFKVYDLSAAKDLPLKSREPRYGNKFYENFNDNKNNWPVENIKNDELKFDNGYLVKRKVEGQLTLWDHVSLDPSQDFVIEIEITHVAGINDGAFGLTWGAKDDDNLFAFKITADGSYKIANEVKGNRVELVPYTDSKFIKQGNAANLLAIKNISDTWHFYIYDKEIYTCPANKFFGDRAGLILHDEQTVKVLSLKAAQLYYNY